MENLNNILTFEEYLSSIDREMLEEGKLGKIVKTGLICLALAGGMLGFENNANAQLIGPKRGNPKEVALNKKIDDVYNTFQNYNKEKDKEIEKMIQDDIASKIELKRYRDSIDSVENANFYSKLEKSKDAFRFAIVDEAGHTIYSYEYSSSDTLLNDLDKIIDKTIELNHKSKHRNLQFTFYLNSISESTALQEFDDLSHKVELTKFEEKRYNDLQKEYFYNILGSEFKFTANIIDMFDYSLEKMEKEINHEKLSKIISKTDTDSLEVISVNKSQISLFIRFYISIKRNKIRRINSDAISFIGYDSKGKAFQFNWKTFEFEERERVSFSREDL